MKYWLATWGRDSWKKFQEEKIPSIGLPRKVDDISIGDVFLNYVKREGNILGQWVSAERIVGPYYYDNKLIYQDGVWPHRWRVEPINPRCIYGSGLVGRDLVNEMEMFRGVPNWGLVLVWMVGKEIPQHDGKKLEDRLRMISNRL